MDQSYRPEKAIPDSEIINEILRALKITARKFTYLIKVGSTTTIYNLKNRKPEDKYYHAMTETMEDKILDAFPQINPDFVRKGIYPVLLNEIPKNLVPLDKFKGVSLASLDEKLSKIEEQNERIEQYLKQLLGIE